MDMIAFGKRLRKLREGREMNQDKLASAVGLKKATISRYEHGTIKKLDTGMACKFAQALNINVEELLQLPQETTLVQIPLAGTIAAGVPIYAGQNIDSHLGVPAGWNVDFALRVRGDSMVGAGIPDGSIVLCRQTGGAERNDIAVCLIGDEEATLKRVKYYQGLMVLHAENPAVNDLVFKGREQNNVKFLGIAKYVIRSL